MDVTRRWPDHLASQRVSNAAVVVTCLVLAVFAVKAQWVELPRPVIAGAGVAGSLAQWWRQRWPRFAAVAGAAAYPLSGNPGPLLVGLYSGACYGPRRQLWVPVVAGSVGFAGWSWIDEGRPLADDAVWAAAAAVATAGLGVYVATRRALAASWREQAESAEAERRLREEQARAAERTRIAREMHDVLAHKVSLIAVHAGALELAASGDPVQIGQGAALIRTTAREALQELRYVLGVLRAEQVLPAHDERGEPFADLGSLVRASIEAGQRVELHDPAGELPPTTARVVYRVVQEGLTNARKHAPGAASTVTVERGEGTVSVTVHNTPGVGVPADLPGSGSGLVGLAERVRLVGGTLHSGPLSLDEGGWKLRAVVPWLEYGPDRAEAEGVRARDAS